MRQIKLIGSWILLFCMNGTCFSQAALPQMQFKGAFSSGHKDFNIYKMFDPTEDVLCYIMMPTIATKKDNDIGQVMYDGNSIGALSCFKIFAAPAKTVDLPAKKK